nr:4911_t:CDS:2 [Entrophospora candida]
MTTENMAENLIKITKIHITNKQLIEQSNINPEERPEEFSEVFEGINKLIEENQCFGKFINQLQKQALELARYQNEIEPQLKQVIESQYNDSVKYNELVPKYNKLNTENEKQNDLNRYKQNKYQQEIEPKYIEKINSLNNNLDRHQHEINTLNNNISCSKANCGNLNNDYTKLNHDKIYQDNKIIELMTENQNKTLFVKDLEKSKRGLEAINDQLRKEASSYQLALEDTLYFHLSSFINIDNGKIQELYGKHNPNNPNINDKISMKTVLQHHNKKKQHMQPFISFAAQNLNQLMTGYCYIKNNIKRKNIEDMAENLIKDITRIFKFRLLVQEPKYETHWFKNDIKINPLIYERTMG